MAEDPVFLLGNMPPDNGFARRFGLLIIAALALLLLLPGTGAIPLIDRDEPRFTEATREMIEGGEWFVPYFNGDYRFDKPVLTYWLMTPGLLLSKHLPSLTPEFGARIHSVLFTILLGWVVFLMGKRWYSPRTGLFSGCGIVSCAQIVMHGRSAVADMPMVLCVALSMWALFELLHNEMPPRRFSGWFFMLYLSLGFGFLAKGPVAWLIPLLTLLLYRLLLGRRKLPWRRLQLPVGLAIALAIVGLWGIPALIKTHGLFWQKGMGEHVMERGFSTMAGFGHFFFYYLLSAFISLFPWIACAGFAFAYLRTHWNARNAYLCSWILSTYLFFSFYFTQLPHYVMPAFAALFLLLGQLAEGKNQYPRWTHLWFRTVLTVPTILASLLFLFTLLYPFETIYLPIRRLLFAASLGLAGLIVMGLTPKRGKHALLIYGALLLALALTLTGRTLRNASVTEKVGAYIQNNLPPETRLYATGFNEPGVVFYSHRRWNFRPDPDEVMLEGMKTPGPCAVLLLEREKKPDYFLRHIARTRFDWNGPQREKNHTEENEQLPTAGFNTLFFEGFNPASTSWATVRLYYREH
ncbi:MAG: glycosyltransferase family 39 protein [Kiritimatiellae bacterium]|nr:glycosyltransferase family 39 protein [Kiritimatiellia bacterium]